VKLSTRGRYGIHAMHELAAVYGGAPVSIKTIAERKDIPEAYLEQIFAMLRRDELITSVRGAQGGYMLSRPPAEIRVGDLLRSLEGGLRLVDCLEDEACTHACECPSRAVWKRINDGLTDIVDSITLEDMLNDEARLMAQGE
jgi:Rrf2 family cysteine metabolism transcriptional repressor